MVKRYFGGVMSPTMAVANSSSATGIFSITTAAQSRFTNQWPMAGVVTSLEYLVVAGGGGGAKGEGIVGTGGGGAGGLLTGSIPVTGGITYTITVGAGGATQPTQNLPGNPGNNSSIDSLVLTYGGGRGGFWTTNFAGGGAGNGGSGGGRGGSTTASANIGYGVYPGSLYIDAPRQGYDGGNGSGTVGSGATNGGGGGGAAGTGTASYMGGPGISSSITNQSVTYATGGNGGLSSGGTNITGPENTGNGGNGGNGDGGAGKAGGSGIAVVRYPDSFGPAVSTTGSPTITVAGGYRVYKFTTSGSITF